MSEFIDEDRIKLLKREENPDAKYVLYWMEQSQRTEYNHALEFAINKANVLNLPLLVVFGIQDKAPEDNLRAKLFMLDGLIEVQQSLLKKNILFIAEKGHPTQVAAKYSREAALVICDKGYLKHQKQWRNALMQLVDCSLFVVESDLVIPVETTSNKEEYNARTIRSKIQRILANYNRSLLESSIKNSSLHFSIKGIDLKKFTDAFIEENKSYSISSKFKGGTAEAKKQFNSWLGNSFDHYNSNRNQPHTADVSYMSMYLHFGQISPLWILQQLQNKSGENKEAYIEELIVRRELAANFVYYNPDYDSYKCIRGWAAESLAKHAKDERGHLYSYEELENAETHDVYWNTCMQLIRETGYLHNHMRMYWGKQIITFTESPHQAYDFTLKLNNRYFLDGNDFNSYTNVAWLFGLHDRAWGERPVFGKVRSMTQKGLERKIEGKKFLELLE